MAESKEYIVPRTGKLSLRFRGECLAEVSSRKQHRDGEWAKHWTELALYQTEGGKYVCECVGRTSLDHENEKNDAVVCDTLDEVVKYFGTGWLAHNLYTEAGLEVYETVE